jgi:hypothetical protein
VQPLRCADASGDSERDVAGSPVNMGRERRQARDPAAGRVEIGIVARAKKLRFRRKPRTDVDAHIESEINPELPRAMERIEGEAYSQPVRENVPDEVEPGTTYRDVRVGWLAGAKLKGVRRRRNPKSGEER